MRLIVYNISLKQQLLVLLPTVFINSIWILIFFFDSPIKFDLVHIILIAACALLFLLPSLVLHINYLIRNCKGPLVVNAEEGSLSIGEGDNNSKFNIMDVRSLTFYSTYSVYSGNLSRFIFDSYRYVKIEFNNKEYIYVTCLMVNEIEKVFVYTFPISMEKKVKIFPLIR